MSNKLTAEQILKVLDDNGISEDEFAYDDVDYKRLGLGEVEEVYQEGGEGQGDEWYSVKHFKDHNVYIKIEGYYQSHNGTEFENGMGEEVRPIEKTITVYE